jgi:oligopeptide/dipeptide ABC transporter ATP-binding protein
MYFNDDGEMKDLLKLDRKNSLELRKKLQIVFQDPYASLNPVHTILEAFDEPMRVHGIGGGDKEKRKEIIAEALTRVNLQPEYMYRYPHEFSGGQRQRICVAKALVLQPKLIVCDEPVSALDVSIQAQLLNLMRKLQKELGITFVFIAHDLSVVQYMSDRIAVMYLGNVVELAEADELYQNTMHPYTQALLSAVPVPKYDAKKDRIVLTGDVPSPMNPPTGCPFHPRCSKCMEICKQVTPKLTEKGGNGHYVACHLFDEK